MNDLTRTDPPFVPTPAPEQVNERWADHHPALLVLASTGIGLAAAAAVGFLAGFLVYSVSAGGCGTDGWCELGAVIYGLLIGCVAAAVGHVTAGVVFIQRCLPAGRRAVPVMLHLGTAIMLAAVLLTLSAM